MKTNISIELSDDEREHLDNIYHNNKTKKLISRKDLNNLIDLLIKELLSEDIGSYKEITTNIAEEGYRFYFNDVRVSPEEYSKGIEEWLKKDKAEKNSFRKRRAR